jgi:hypothetical protein
METATPSAEPALAHQLAHSAITDYACDLSNLGSKDGLYTHVWVTQRGHQIGAQVNQHELVACLKLVASNNISENQIQFALMALDLVQETSHGGPEGEPGPSEGRLPYDFRLFRTIASLSERIVALDSVVSLESLDFSDGKALHLKVVRARQLFHLSEGAQSTGTMSFEELESICLAGNVDMAFADNLVDAVTERGSFEQIEFLDFLSYLPLFIEAHEAIKANPMGANSTKRLSRPSQPPMISPLSVGYDGTEGSLTPLPG